MLRNVSDLGLPISRSKRRTTFTVPMKLSRSWGQKATQNINQGRFPSTRRTNNPNFSNPFTVKLAL